LAPKGREEGEREVSSGKRKRGEEEGRVRTADKFHPLPSSGCQAASPFGSGIFLQILSITSEHQLVLDSFIPLALGRRSKSKPDCLEPGRPFTDDVYPGVGRA
jgi:hypothetical protein